MQTKYINLGNVLNKAVLIGVCVVLIALILLFAKWAFGHAIAVNASEAEVAELGVDLAANDAHAHFEFGQLLEKTLLPADQPKAYNEFETAVSLSPNNYAFWLALGRVREQSGDAAGAEGAFRKAAELAPNYSRVQWALGNALLRQGRRDEAFVEIRKAAAGDPTFANPAAGLAWQIFDGDVDAIHAVIGDSPRINGSIAVLLATDKRYAEAMDFWRRIPANDLQNELKETGQTLYNKLVEGGRFRSAIEVAGDVGLFSDGEVAIGKISNGGFESSLSPQIANVFSWVIADGGFPRIGLNESQKRSGNYSLLMNFGQGAKGFRQVTQKIGVEPAGAYDLQFFYRSELTTDVRLRCEVVSAGGGSPIAGTTLSAKQDWTEVKLPFAVPSDVEGIEVRITIESCSSANCTIAGNIWFDDFSLSKR